MENFHSMDGMSHIDLDQSTIPSLDFNFISIDRFYLDVPFPKSTTLALDDLPPPELYRDTYALRGPPLSFFG